MGETQVWLDCAGDIPERERAAAALAGAGVELGAGAAAGVVLFRAPSDGLVELLRTRSADGVRRVVAVCTDVRIAGAIAWPLLDAGASDVLFMPASEIGAPVAARIARWREVDALVAAAGDRLIGADPAWVRVLRDLVEVARFTDTSLLITGESGTGKELVARLVHELDPRRDKRSFVVLDCTTVVPTLSGSEFFGHEKGAFTGAVAAREGAFGLADGGTLFLDEVGELSMTMQAELLRVVQEGTYKRVGSDTWRSTDFRLVCATNRDLATEETSGRFRRDFYYRIAAWTCRLPSLRERRGDIERLATVFLGEALPAAAELTFDPAVLDLLRTRDYPGNVRELRQLVERIAARHVGDGPVTVGDVPPEERPAADAPTGDDDIALERVIRRSLDQGASLPELRRRIDDAAVRVALAETSGNLQRAAHRLGITARALQLRRATTRRVALERASDPRPRDDVAQ